MKDLYLMGGPLYMGILTILFIAMVAWMIFTYTQSSALSSGAYQTRLNLGKSIGLFAFITGILFQLIGFYFVLSRLEEVGEVAPGVLYGGLKVSMITTVYGMLIYLTALMLFFLMGMKKIRDIG